MKQLLFTILFFSIMHIANAQGAARIKITIGSASFVVTTYDNATARAFVALLPMTVSMSELNGNEKYYYLSGSLPALPESLSIIKTGDLMLYGTNYIVLFYETFSTSYSYTKIGYMDDIAGLKDALGSGHSTVTFELLNIATAIEDIQQNEKRITVSSGGVIQYSGWVDKMQLIDIAGRILATSTTNELNVNFFPKGIYILLVDEKNKTKSIKIKL